MIGVGAAAVVVERVGVEVAPLDHLGRPWDSGKEHAAPDPQIDIVLDGEKLVRCKQTLDSLTSECEAPDHAALTSATEIELRVNDADVGLDERIGTARGSISPDATGRIALEVRGKVVSAWVEVRHTPDPWMSPLVAWASALAVGAALGLAIGFARRRKSVRLVGRAAAVIAVAAAWFVYPRTREPLVSAIPLALGALTVTAVLVEIAAHKALGKSRLRTLLAGGAAMAAVFALRWSAVAPDLARYVFLAAAVLAVLVLVAAA